MAVDLSKPLAIHKPTYDRGFVWTPYILLRGLYYRGRGRGATIALIYWAGVRPERYDFVRPWDQVRIKGRQNPHNFHIQHHWESDGEPVRGKVNRWFNLKNDSTQPMRDLPALIRRLSECGPYDDNTAIISSIVDLMKEVQR